MAKNGVHLYDYMDSFEKLTSTPTFVNHKIFNENLVAPCLRLKKHLLSIGRHT